MNLSDFDYVYPPELIARYPAEERGGSRLMVVHRQSQEIHHTTFKHILDFLTPGDVVVVNKTKVIPVRIFGKKETGANIEIFLLEEISKNLWKCLAFPIKRLHAHTKILFEDNYIGEIQDIEEGFIHLSFSGDVREYVQNYGHIPLPPYMERSAEPVDKDRYQTIFSSVEGAVAAPTAGLHWTENLCREANEKGISIVPILLHVGYGTFEPIRVPDIRQHQMHREYIEISEEAASLINTAKRVVAVGSTVVRALESSSVTGVLKPYKGWTDLYIYPGYEFKTVDMIQTNFHQPHSSLLVMVSAFAGLPFIKKAYQEAIQHQYKMFSYGDTMLIA